MKHILAINGSHTQATLETFAAMCKKDEHLMEIRPSRAGNFQLIAINGHVVARAFDSLVDMLNFKAARA